VKNTNFANMLMTEILNEISFVISVISLCIIAYGSIIGVILFLKNEFGRINNKYNLEYISIIRLRIGYYLLLGLEFLIASDIIRTILEPSFQDLAILGGIVVVRTVLTIFLNKEVEEGKKAEKEFSV